MSGIGTTSIVGETRTLLLGKYPQLQQELYDKLYHVFKDNQFGSSKVNQCGKLKAFINQTLRVAIPAPD